MIALFETRDGMTRWMEVDRSMRYGDRIRFALIPALTPVFDPSDARFVPDFRTREYELMEVRTDPRGREYLYYLERWD